MPKKAKELSVKKVASLVNKPVIGFHPVGGTGAEGLAIQVKNENAASWILRVTVHGKRRDIGLGGYPLVSLKEAREEAQKIKKAILKGHDPILERKRLASAQKALLASAITFKEVAGQFIAKKWDDYEGKDIPKRIQKLENQLEYYAFPVIGNLLLDDIDLPHIQKILDPIWKSKTDTAGRVRLNIEHILDYAITKKLRQRENNPARWKGYLDKLYTRPSKISKVKHHAALPVEEMPKFFKALEGREGISVLVLKFTILTAARPGEARAAKWSQIDLDAKTWTIPAEEMKAGKEHMVPLCNTLVQMLKSLPRESEYIFPGKKSAMVSDVVVSKLAKSITADITVHGFRSTFKDWARTHAKQYRDEISELALAHKVGSEVREAYARDRLVDERRLMMAEWDRFCHQGPVSGVVIPLKERA